MKNLLKWSVLLLFFTSTTFLNAAEIYVDINVSGSNDGQSWTNAFTDLQDALAVAGNGDEIWVANGVYKPTTTTDRDISFNIPDGVELYGGFAGGETNRADRDWQTNASIISGAIGSQVDVTDNTKRLILINNADDVEIESCFFSANTTNTSGTVYGVAGFDLNMTNCTLFNNDLPDLSRVIDGNGTNDSWEIVNSIIWANDIDNNLEPIRNVGPGTDVRLSIVQNGHTGGTMVFDEDPQFMNAGGGDFGLQPSSVGFNAGDDSVVEEELDAVRNDRIRAGQVDFGAVESSGTPASVIYIDQDATGANNGSSWADADTSLYDGLAASVDGDHVWVAEGVYLAPTLYEVNEGIDLHGGFDGTETLLSEANWNVNETIISGDLGVTGVQTDNAEQLVRISLDETPVTVSGFIFEEAYSTGTFFRALSVVNSGGFEGESVLDVQNCVFRELVYPNNFLSTFIISNANLSNSIEATFENCLFHDLTSSNSVTGVGNSQADLYMIGCTFTQNTITGPLGSQVSGATAIENSIFWANTGSESSFSSAYGNSVIGSNNIYQAGSVSGSNNLIADPNFVDPSNNDFSLLPSSPAIGLGENAEVFSPLDLAFNTRVQNAGVDAGAYESPFTLAGCTDMTACNYNPNADTDDGSCTGLVLQLAQVISIMMDSLMPLTYSSC